MTARGSRLGHGLRVVGAQLKINTARLAAYRADFILEAIMSLTTIAVTLLPLMVIYGHRATIGDDWDESSALIVIAYFVALSAVLEGVITPALQELTAMIRTGSFDYVLLKPVDSQLLVSTARVDPWSMLDMLAAIAIAIYAFHQRGSYPSAGECALGLALLATGAVALYAVFIACSAASFWVVRLDNLMWLLNAVFDTARWPVQVFRGAWRFVFTFVVPVAIMTTYPAMALLGRLDPMTALATLGGTLVLLAVARAIWRLAIRNYTSASS